MIFMIHFQTIFPTSLETDRTEIICTRSGTSLQIKNGKGNKIFSKQNIKINTVQWVTYERDIFCVGRSVLATSLCNNFGKTM